jgi:hypothetical protein
LPGKEQLPTDLQLIHLSLQGQGGLAAAPTSTDHSPACAQGIAKLENSRRDDYAGVEHPAGSVRFEARLFSFLETESARLPLHQL